MKQESVVSNYDVFHQPHYHESFRKDASVARATRYIKNNLGVDVSLQDLADIGGYSVYHFVRIFFEKTFLSPMNYLTAARIDAAKKSLVTTDNKIIDICFDVGYNSVGSFGKRFTKMVGMCPRQLRGRAKEFDLSAFRSMFDSACEMSSAIPPLHPQIICEVSKTLNTDRDLHIFVGLFDTKVPSIAPVACAVRKGPGVVRLNRPFPGNYQVYALALPMRSSAEELLLQTNSLRGLHNELPVIGNEHVVRTKITLSAPEVYHAPVLPVLPLMMTELMGRLS